MHSSYNESEYLEKIKLLNELLSVNEKQSKN